MRGFLDRCEDAREAAEKAFFKPKGSLKDRALFAYVMKTLGILKPLLEEGPRDPKKLKEFFRVHWEQYKHTPFSYTALPDHGITKLLWFVAQEITRVERKGKESPGILNVLMPGVRTSSLMDGYRDLCPSEESQWKDVGLEVLRTHIVSDDGHYLIPVKRLADLESLPNDHTKIDNAYYDYNVPGEPCHNTLEFSRLAEHSDVSREFVQLFKEYEDFVKQDSSLYGQLAQLCRQLYFNSVSARGEEADAGAGAYTAIARFNEYYEALPEGEKRKVPGSVKSEIEKIQRLASPYGVTNDTKDQQAQAAAIASEIIQAEADGLASASAAGSSHQITAVAEKDIKEKNAARDHVSMIDTCLATRRTSLSAAIEAEQEFLGCIGLGGEKKVEILG